MINNELRLIDITLEANAKKFFKIFKPKVCSGTAFHGILDFQKHWKTDV